MYVEESDDDSSDADAALPAHGMLQDGLQPLADGGFAGTPLSLMFDGGSPFVPSLLWAGPPVSGFTSAAAIVVTELRIDIWGYKVDAEELQVCSRNPHNITLAVRVAVCVVLLAAIE